MRPGPWSTVTTTRSTVLAVAVVAASACHTAVSSGVEPPRPGTFEGVAVFGHVYELGDMFSDSLQATSPVAGATVWIEPSGTPVLTDEDGYWRFDEGLVPGSIAIRAERIKVDGTPEQGVVQADLRLGETQLVIVIGIDRRVAPGLDIDPLAGVFRSRKPIDPRSVRVIGGGP